MNERLEALEKQAKKEEKRQKKDRPIAVEASEAESLLQKIDHRIDQEVKALRQGIAYVQQQLLGIQEDSEKEDSWNIMRQEVGSLFQRMSQETGQELKQLHEGMVGLQQQLHEEISKREASCSIMRESLADFDMGIKKGLQAVEEKLQSHEGIEIRVERAFAMLHDEHVAREGRSCCARRTLV